MIDRAVDAASGRIWVPVLAFAAVVLIAAAVWFRPEAKPASTALVIAPVQPAPPPAAPATSPAPAGPEKPIRETLMALARVEPPAYVPVALRIGDAPSPVFEDAMQAYAARKYDQAADRLRRVITSDPDDTQANFYLAVALLMTDDVEEALDLLRAVTAADDSRFRQTARVLTAKALIRTGDLDGAERELSRAGRGGGPRAQEATALLAQLRAARNGARGRG